MLTRTPIADIHILAGFPYLNRMRFCHTAVEMYKVVHDIAPDIIKNRFAWVNDISNVNTRLASRGDLYVPVTRLQQMKNSFVCHGVMTWNGFPDEARLARNIQEFKKWVEVLF